MVIRLCCFGHGGSAAAARGLYLVLVICSFDMFFYYYGDVRTHLPSDVPRLDDFSDVGSPLKAEYLATRERFGHQGKIIQLKVGRARPLTTSE